MSGWPSPGRLVRGLALVLVLALLPAPAAVAQRPSARPAVTGRYLYTLASFTGPITYNWSRVAVDRERNEVYALYQNRVHVFNDAGMEIFRFGDDLDVGQLADLQVDERGDILLLAYRESRAVVVRCDFRGRPQGEFTLTDLPAAFAGFAPNRMVYRNGQFTFASTTGLAVVLADRQGRATLGYDLFRLFELEEKDRGGVELGGFSVDGQGNILMTVPVLFRAFVLSPDGKLAGFGQAGGAPGRFNIAGGIDRDSRGNILVVDRLKGAILVFNAGFRFIAQFSARGHGPGQLIFPDDLVIDARDRAYVTQAGRRGISVFGLS